MIYESFRCTGISNNLNHSQDGLFTVWKKIPIVENDLEVNYDNLNKNEILDDEED